MKTLIFFFFFFFFFGNLVLVQFGVIAMQFLTLTSLREQI